MLIAHSAVPLEILLLLYSTHPQGFDLVMLGLGLSIVWLESLLLCRKIELCIFSYTKSLKDPSCDHEKEKG